MKKLIYDFLCSSWFFLFFWFICFFGLLKMPWTLQLFLVQEKATHMTSQCGFAEGAEKGR